MAVNRTIRTKLGVAEFLLSSEDGDEPCTAFRYTDHSVEVHAVNRDCAPLALPQDTKVGLNKLSDSTLLLTSVTLTANEVNLRVWDANNLHGFSTKDIRTENGTRATTYTLHHDLDAPLQNVVFKCHEAYVCVVLNGHYLMLGQLRRDDSPGVVGLHFDAATLLHETASVINDVVFLSHEKITYLCLAEQTSVNMMSIENNMLLSAHSLALNQQPACKVARFHKLTSSKSLVVDANGRLWLLATPFLELNPLKLPCSTGGHGVCAVVGFKHISEGVLAVCNGEHTVNLYSLADVLSSAENYVKPYRILCSQFPVNALTFVRSDQLALASSVNTSISFWAGFSV